MFVPILKFIGKFIWRLSAISNPFSLVGLSVGAISSFSWAQVARADAPLLPDRSLGKPSAHLLNTPPILPDYSWENFTTLSLHLPTELEEVEFPARNPSPLVTPENQETGNIYELEESERFSADTIRVTQFEFEGNTVFDREELEEVIKKALSLEELPANLTFSQLLQARSAVTQHYIDQGYITSGAYIPEQSFDTEEGVIRIHIVEGRLPVENIRITQPENNGNQSDREYAERYENYKQCLQRQIGSPAVFNKDRLLETLQMLLDPDPTVANQSFFSIQSLAADLVPGESIGENRLDLNIELGEPKASTPITNLFNSLDAQLFFKNNSSPSIGSIERGFNLEIGTFATIEYTNTDGSNAIDTTFYLPNMYNDHCSRNTLIVRTGIKSSKLLTYPFNQLDIESDSYYLNTTYRSASSPNPSEEQAWSATFSWQESSSTLLGSPFPLSTDADDLGVTRILTLRAALERRYRSRQEVLNLRGELSFGTSIIPGNSLIIPEGLDPFLVLRGQAQWVRRLAPDTLFFLNGTIQLSPSRLPAFEQIGIGGQATVRGYRKNFLLTDSGALLSAELQLPILRIPAWDSTVWLNPFVDVGMGWNTFNVSPDSNFLWSTGLGLQWKVGDRLTARLDWGIPLVSVPSRGNSLQENSLSFSLVWKVVNSGF